MSQASKPRARELGIPFLGMPGPFNAITDVAGVEVGFRTLIQGTASADTAYDSDFARTGVTAVLPRGRRRSAVFAGRHDLNGNGELTGTHWIDGSGFLHGPILLTNTHSVGVVRDGAAQWMISNHFFYPPHDEVELKNYGFFYPVVGETFDGILNNTNGFKVTGKDALLALENAAGGPVREGNVGGGTGMICHGFKGGTGTSSRILGQEEGGYRVGVLVQANHGRREHLLIAGIPMGREIEGAQMEVRQRSPLEGTGSIIAIVATDAPVLPWQLSNLCKRISMGIGKLGGGHSSGSGDIFLAFSTANEEAFSYNLSTVTLLSDEKLNPLYRAVEEATEEAIVNALVAAEDMVGRNLNYAAALPHGQVRSILRKYKTYLSGRYGDAFVCPAGEE